MARGIDLDFRPSTYFRPKKLERDLLSRVEGTALRKKLKELFAAGRHNEVGTLLNTDDLSAESRSALASIHPMFMSGNYLPAAEQGEVEIARITIMSTTRDVTSVCAQMVEGAIHYRVVDEYEGDTLQDVTKAQTDRPMTLGELADFFLNAWPLLDVLEMNCEGDLDESLDFFTARSAFYPEFGRLCKQRVIDHFSDSSGDADDMG